MMTWHVLGFKTPEVLQRRSLQPPRARSFLESSPSAKSMTWRVRCMRPDALGLHHAHSAAYITVRHERPDASSTRQVTFSACVRSSNRQRLKAPPNFINDRTHWPSVRSHHEQHSITDFQWKSTSLLHQLIHPWSTMPTTKCITLCTCVSIFLQTFSRVLALTTI